MRYSLPLSPSLERKFEALSEGWRSAFSRARGHRRDRTDRFSLVRPVRPRVLDGASFYALLPFRVMRELRDFRPDAVLAQVLRRRPLGSRAQAGARTDEGDRGHPRGSGGSDAALRITVAQGTSRRSPMRSAAVARGGRRGPHDLRLHLGHRARSRSGADRGVRCVHGPRAVPRAHSRAAPERPAALFVGVLERYKAVDVLAEAWRLAAARVPDATLHVVGRGTLRDVVERLVAELPAQTRWTESLTNPGRCACLGRGDRARAALALGGARPHRRGGLLSRPRSRGEPRRRHSGRRRGRSDGHPGRPR